MTGSLLCQRINGNGVTEALVADVGQERRLRGRVSVPAASCDHSGRLMRATVTSAPILFSSVLVRTGTSSPDRTHHEQILHCGCATHQGYPWCRISCRCCVHCTYDKFDVHPASCIVDAIRITDGIHCTHHTSPPFIASYTYIPIVAIRCLVCVCVCLSVRMQNTSMAQCAALRNRPHEPATAYAIIGCTVDRDGDCRCSDKSSWLEVSLLARKATCKLYMIDDRALYLKR
jgi:hypothetical protein